MSSAIAKLPKKMAVPPAGHKLRIAIVYSRNPLPMITADQMTVAHLMSFLKERGHEIDLYCVAAGGLPEREQVNWLNDTCKSVKQYEHSWKQKAFGLIRGFIKGLPLQVGLFSHSEMIRDVRAAAHKYDIIYTYYIRSAEATRSINALPANASAGRPATFLAMQLSQALNTRRIAANAPNIFFRVLYEVESRLVANYEAVIWKDFTRSILIGRKDVEEIQHICEQRNLPAIDNFVFGAHGTDLDRFKPRKEVVVRPDHLIFSGVMRTPTNIQAVQWFASRVWPLIKERRPNATWDIVGRDPSPEVYALEKLPGVHVVGSVPDTSLPIAAAAVCINPMQAGGGMQNKLLEYMASGKAIVATTVANEGIQGEHQEHLLVADSPAAFADAVVTLLDNVATREQLGARARRYALENWSWEAHWLKLEQNFYGALSELSERKCRDL